MQKIAFIFLFFLGITSNAQIVNNTQITLTGNPTWFTSIPLPQNGAVLLLKEDQTRFKIIRYDSLLVKLWEQDLFLDTEKSPKIHRLHNNNLAIAFSETNGMYYQILDFNLNNGEYRRYGFEIKDFFHDQEMVVYPNQIVLLGTTQKGLAFYRYIISEEVGQLQEIFTPGKYTIQKARLLDNHHIQVLVSEQIMGYSKPDKQKGEYIKSTAIHSIELDSLGNLVQQKNVLPKGGKFPMSAIPNTNHTLVSGIYKDTEAQFGLYFSELLSKENTLKYAIGFNDLLKPYIADTKKRKAYLATAQFYLFEPRISQDQYHLGGVFYVPITSTVTKNKKVVQLGYDFSFAFIIQLSKDTMEPHISMVPIQQTLPTLNPPIRLNDWGQIAYLSQGKLLIKDLNKNAKPIVYQLTDDPESGKSPKVPAYIEVNHLNHNLFLAIGRKSTQESIEVPNTKKKNNSQFTQIRKTYYLTALKAEP